MTYKGAAGSVSSHHIKDLTPYSIGREIAKQILDHKKPKTQAGILAVVKLLENYLETQYPLNSNGWRFAWGQGASTELQIYEQDMLKRNK